MAIIPRCVFFSGRFLMPFKAFHSLSKLAVSAALRQQSQQRFRSCVSALVQSHLFNVSTLYNPLLMKESSSPLFTAFCWASFTIRWWRKWQRADKTLTIWCKPITRFAPFALCRESRRCFKLQQKPRYIKRLYWGVPFAYKRQHTFVLFICSLQHRIIQIVKALGQRWGEVSGVVWRQDFFFRSILFISSQTSLEADRSQRQRGHSPVRSIHEARNATALE